MNALTVLPEIPTREQIERFEAVLLQAEAQGHGVSLPVRHYRAGELVAREIVIPAGTLLTGAAHRFPHLNVSSGDITVWTEDGMRRLTGHHTIESKPGAKRVGWAHAETTWTTFHAVPAGLETIEEIEDYLVEDSHQLQSRREFVLKATPAEQLA